MQFSSEEVALWVTRKEGYGLWGGKLANMCYKLLLTVTLVRATPNVVVSQAALPQTVS